MARKTIHVRLKDGRTIYRKKARIVKSQDQDGHHVVTAFLGGEEYGVRDRWAPFFNQEGDLLFEKGPTKPAPRERMKVEGKK